MDNQACKIYFDHPNDRKTGPCFALDVMRCGTHKKGFTLYPPGYAPYQRKSIAPVAPDGNLIIGGSDEQRFAGTYFDAALDAAKNQAWPFENYSGNLQPRFRTQLRQLDRAALLLGIKPDIDEHLREETAQILSVPGQLLNDNTAFVKEHPGYPAMGTAICNVLKALPITATLFERIAEAGAVAAFWPSPDVWDGRHNILRPSLFRRIRTRAAP